MANFLAHIGVGIRRYLTELNGCVFIDETALLDPGLHSLRAVSGRPEPESTSSDAQRDGIAIPLLAPLEELPLQPLDVDPGLVGGI